MQDTGIGMEPDLQKLVLQHFYPIGHDERGCSNGLGLVRAIGQQLCAQ